MIVVQNLVFGRAYTALAGSVLMNLASDLTAPVSNRTITAIDYMSETAFGISDEDSRQAVWREELAPGSSSKPLTISPGTQALVNHLKKISGPGTDPFDSFVASWTLGKVRRLNIGIPITIDWLLTTKPGILRYLVQHPNKAEKKEHIPSVAECNRLLE
jgi:hypothetical protein